MSLNAQKIREDFPILERKVHGKPLVYFDNAATTQKPRQVIEAMNDYYRNYNANVHRAVHSLSAEASNAWEQAHEKAAKFVGAKSWDEMVFTKNATEAINLVAYSLLKKQLKAGDEILLTKMEHHSNLVPWQQLALAHGLKVNFANVRSNGTLDTEDFEKKLSKKTKLVAFTNCSNVLGTINPAEHLIKVAHEFDALVLVDGAQSTPHMPVDVRNMDADFFVFSAHKMLGPTGIGALYAKKDLLERMEPFLYGGDMIAEVFLDHTVFNKLPWRFEAGTPNIAEGIGLSAAIDYLQKLGMENVREHEKKVMAVALRALHESEGVTVYGPDEIEKRSGVVSFNLKGIHPHDVASILDRYGIAVRSGDHCGQPLMRELGIKGTARASFYVYNTPDEIKLMAEVLHKAKQFMG